jgi:hypothetical protein
LCDPHAISITACVLLAEIRLVWISLLSENRAQMLTENSRNIAVDSVITPHKVEIGGVGLILKKEQGEAVSWPLFLAPAWQSPREISDNFC